MFLSYWHSVFHLLNANDNAMRTMKKLIIVATGIRVLKILTSGYRSH